MTENREDKSVSLNKQAFDRLVKAKKKGESFSDVVIRLSEIKVAALQRRGEKEITTSDGHTLVVQIIQDKCMGAESCVVVAPTVFALDSSRLGGFRRGAEPLGMREVEERTVDSETVILAAKSCPYRAIYVKDVETGEELAG
jgi:ferredoxin/predicted CopG family antitoxin